MNRNVIEAQEIIRMAITYTANRKAQGILARAAFYLTDQVWGTA